jgi:anti-anti-sigma regulatory factor
MPASKRGPIVVDARRLAPSGATIDRLARKQLSARRRGRRIVVRGASADLERLISLAGLDEVLLLEPRC